MSDTNVVVISGRLCREPEIKKVGDKSVCSMRIASNKRFSKDRERNLFIDVEVWGIQGENCAKYLKKGNAITASGYLRQDTWGEGENKKSKIFVEANDIEFHSLGSNQKDDQPQEEAASTPPQDQAQRPQASQTRSSRPPAANKVATRPSGANDAPYPF